MVMLRTIAFEGVSSACNVIGTRPLLLLWPGHRAIVIVEHDTCIINTEIQLPEQAVRLL